jgi:hypothetical protein
MLLVGVYYVVYLYFQRSRIPIAKDRVIHTDLGIANTNMKSQGTDVEVWEYATTWE